MTDKVKRALESTEGIMQSSKKSRVELALENTEKFVKNNINTIISGIQTDYENAISNYNSFEKTSFGKENNQSTVNTIATNNGAIDSIKNRLNAYRSYIGDDKTVDNMLLSLDTISEKYGAYRKMADMYSAQQNGKVKAETIIYASMSENEKQALEAAKLRYKLNYTPGGEKTVFALLSREQYSAVKKYADKYAEHTGINAESIESTLARLTGDFENNENFLKNMEVERKKQTDSKKNFDLANMNESLKTKISRTSKNLFVTLYDDPVFSAKVKELDIADMTDEERITYYRKKDVSQLEADNFYKTVVPYIEARRIQPIVTWAENLGKNANGSGGASALAILCSMASGLEHLSNTIRYVETGVMGYNQMSAMSSAIKKGVSEKYNIEICGWDAFDFVYNTAMSGAESVVNTALFGAYGSVSLGLSAAASQSNDILQRGGTAEQAFWGGLASGVFEGIFEKYTIGDLKALKEANVDSLKTLFKNMAKSMATNASEETLTEISNIAYDTIMNGDVSNYNVSIKKYMEEGLSKKEATKKTLIDMFLQVVEAGASGALMGIGFSGFAGTKSLISSNKNSYAKIGNNITAKNLTEKIFAMADGLDEKSPVREFASKLKNEGNYNAADLGKLAVLTATEIRRDAFTEVKGALYDRLIDAGQDSDSANKSAIAIASVLAGESITAEQKSELLKTKVPNEIYSEMFSENSVAWVQELNNTLKQYTDKLKIVSVAFSNTTQNTDVQTDGESDVVVDDTSNTALSEAEQKLIDTPDSELTPEQRAVKQTILERQQKNITRNGDVDGGEVGFGEPTTKEIYRKSTAEEEKEALFGKRKDAKQRHILDVAKKLDSDMTVVFVDPDNKKLSGRAGVFIHNTNTMYLSNDNSVVGMYCQLFKHEFVHRLESKGAYQSFKNYLLKHSSAFENYVRAKLRAINGTEFDGTREEALNAFRDYYIGLVQNGDFTAEYKRNFTAEYAEREMVADFVGEILFKGKEKRADVAQNLADGEIDKIIKLEDTFAEFENLNETERSWFRKAIDVIKDWIASLKGIKQNERLVNDLEYIEKRLSRVLDSKDTKKAASRAVDREFSIKSFKDGRQFVDVDVEQERFDGLNDSELRREAKKVIKEKFLGKVIGENNRAYVKKDSAEEYAYPSKYIQDSDIIEAKMRASTELDNLIDVGDNYRNEPDGKYGHSHPEATGGFDYYDAIFKVGNKYYYGLVNIMVTNRGKVFKDLTKIEDITNDIIAQYGNNPQGDFVGTSSTDIILNEEDSVKNNVSSESENYSEDSGEIKQSFALEIPSKQENEDGLSSLGSPMQIARENLIKYENGELTREQYLEENERLWGEAIEKYGSIPEGENADAPIVTPKAVEEGKLTERFVRTIIETGKLTEEAFENIEEKVLLGDFSYKAVSDEASIKKSDTAIKNGTAEDIWENTVNSDKYIRKENIAIGEQLLADAIQKGDAKRVLELSSELADIFTRAGQVVQAAQLLKKMTGAGRLISAQRVVKTINKDLAQKYGVTRKPVKISTEAAERLANAKTEKGIEHAYGEIMQEVADQMPSTFIDKFNAWRYWAMLSGPRTHIRNIVGNAIFLPMVRAKNTIAYVLENAAVKKGKLDVADRTKSLVIKKEYADFAKNDGNNAKVTELLKGNKYNDKSVIKEKQKIFKTEAFNFLTELNSNLLESEDMLFKNKHYIHALASFLQSRNADLNNLSQELLADARIYAVKEAKKATFNDENALADYIQRFGNKNIGTAIAVEGILPYKRTPLNIIRRGVEYSPIGLGTAITKGIYDVKKGKISVTEYIDGLAAGLTGTGVMLVGMFLANLGIVVGGLGDDDESVFEKLTGKQEYSIEILGNSYTIDWLAPSVIPFMLGAEIVNTIREGEKFDFADILEVSGNILEPVTELSCLSGLQGVIESARYADGSQALIAITSDVMTSYAMQAIPSLSGAVARTVDQTQRSWYIDKNSKWFDTTTQTVWNNIRSKIPGLTYTQAPKIGVWGEEVSRGNVGERLAENFISPGYYSKVDYNDMNNELLRLGKATGENIYPKTAPKFFTVNGETKLLTADEYVTYAKAKGQYSYDYVDELMAKKSYNKLTDEEKAKVIKNLYEYANAKAKTTVSDYDLNKQYKTVTHWERNGNSAVDYYIAKAIKD